MHTKKAAVYFAAVWMAAIALVPLSGITVADSGGAALELSDVTLVVGDLPARAGPDPLTAE